MCIVFLGDAAWSVVLASACLLSASATTPFSSADSGMTLLFKGGQGTVFRGTLHGAPVAIKRLPLTSKRAAQCETAAVSATTACTRTQQLSQLGRISPPSPRFTRGSCHAPAAMLAQLQRCYIYMPWLRAAHSTVPACTVLCSQAERLVASAHPHIVSYLAHSRDSFGNSLLYTELGVCDLQQVGSQAPTKR